MRANEYHKPCRLFHLLSLPGRLCILCELHHGDACVYALQRCVARPQPYVSQQLRVLREAGIVGAYRAGTQVFYHLQDPMMRRLLDVMLGQESENGTWSGAFSGRRRMGEPARGNTPMEDEG